MNPFEIPGAVDSHSEPLRPWVHPEHMDLYVDVDGFEAEFASFQETFRTLGALTEVGGLVLVTGTDTCGKTSLINRCAHWLRAELPNAGLQPAIVDLTARVPPNIGVDQRMTLAYELLLQDQNQAFSEAGFAELMGYRNDLLRGYVRMGDALLDDRVLLVLLPVVELAKEIEEYAPLVQRRVVFLAESPEPMVAAAAGALKMPYGTRIARLSLSSLRAGDGRRFSKKRTGEDGTKCIPPLNVDAAEELFTDRHGAGNSVTIGQLQRFLYGVYKEIGEMPVPSSAQVTYNEIIRHIAKQVRLS